VTAIDVAAGFVGATAEHLGSRGIRYTVASGMLLPFAARVFDFAAAFMSLMDLGAPERALPEIARVLRRGGFLQFSILHPCFSPPHRRLVRDRRGAPCAIEVGRYFDRTDGEIDRWLFSAAPPEAKAGLAPFETPLFHRTLADWLNAIAAARFRVEHCVEPMADLATAARVRELADTRIAPNFLLMRRRLR